MKIKKFYLNNIGRLRKSNNLFTSNQYINNNTNVNTPGNMTENTPSPLFIPFFIFCLSFALDDYIKCAHNIGNTTATLSILRDVAQPWRFFYAYQNYSGQLYA